MNKNEEKYLGLLKEVLEKGTPHGDRTGTGTIRLFSGKTTYDLADGFPLFTTRKNSLRLVVEELIWMLSGSTDNQQLIDKKVGIWTANASASEMAKFNRKENDLGPIYGHQFRNYGATTLDQPLEADYWSEPNRRWVNRGYKDDGFDQIKDLVESIQKTPNSRRIIVSTWNPKEAKLVNPPFCHTMVHVRIENGAIDLILYSRSSDLFLGTNFNVPFYALLMELLAIVTNLKCGSFSHHMGDYHIYNDHLDQVKEQLSRTPFPAPTIKINDRLRGKGFEGLLDFKWEDIEVIGYQSHPPIKAKMSV